MPPPIKKLADRFLSNPKSVEVARPASTNTNIRQWLVETDSRRKRETLRELMLSEDVTTAIVFCNRKTTVRELATSLKRHRFRAGEIHGDMDQASRIRELDRFKAGEINVLVASDVAARGLDIKGVSHVFNFDAPWHPDDYVHRIGRTGRAGATGTAFTFVTKEDAEAIENIEKLTGMRIDRVAPLQPSTVQQREEPEKSAKPARRSRTERAQRATAEKPETRKPAQAARPAPKPTRQADAQRVRDEDAGEGWNGPIPSFLNQTLGR
jgi:superfamily II DNA/RNA helicase